MLSPDAPKILFVWIGDFRERLLTAVTETRPDELYFVLESKNLKWREWHREIADWVKLKLGRGYTEGKSLHEIVMEEDVEEQEFYSFIIARICRELRRIKNNQEHIKAIFDVTGAPTAAQQMLTLVGLLLSSENAKIYIQHVGRQLENDPIYHANKSSKYYSKHKDELHGIADKPLAEYREMETIKDKGAKIRRFLCPTMKLDLLNGSKDIENTLAEQLLFLSVPCSRSKMEKASDILEKIKKMPYGSEILTRAAKKRAEKVKRSSETIDVEHANQVWVSSTLQRWREDVGLVDTERRSIHLYAQKTDAGELFTRAVREFHEELLPLFSQTNQSVPDEGSEVRTITEESKRSGKHH